MDYPMTTVIASRQMTRTRQDNVQITVTVEIGCPQPTPSGSPIGGWYAPIRFQNAPSLTEVIPFFGEDSTMALVFATAAPGRLLTAMPYAHEIDFSNLENFGYAEPPIVRRGATLSGTVTLENCNDPQQNVTFEFRPKNGTVTPDGNPVVIRQVLTNTGTFRLEGIPNGTYDLAIKAYLWLRKVIPNVVVNGSNISGLNVTLLGGDVNNTNAVDIGDLTQVIGHYNRLGDP